MVKQRFAARKNPNAYNLRQVHLLHEELFEELRATGFNVRPGNLGENVTKRGLDVLELPQHTKLRLGAEAIVELTGLRHPCRQIDSVCAWQISSPAIIPTTNQTAITPSLAVR
jgi:MOSC domain-containing protein YiiM